jgi:hypothetical protein
MLLAACAQNMVPDSEPVQKKPLIRAYESRSIYVPFKSFEITESGDVTLSNRTALMKRSRLNKEQLTEVSRKLSAVFGKYRASGILSNAWVGVTLHDVGYRAIAFSAANETFELRGSHPRMGPDYWPTPPVSTNYSVFRSAWDEVEGICKTLPLYHDFMTFDPPE